jgi:hypothetical protein
MAGKAATPAAKRKNFRRRSFMVMLHEREHLPECNINDIKCLLLTQSGHWLEAA